MLTTNITHFLDDKGNIPDHLPDEAQGLANFFVEVISSTTLAFPVNILVAKIKCPEKDCKGYIWSQLTKKTDDIYWKCNKCPNEGTISEWQGTKWDNTR